MEKTDTRKALVLSKDKVTLQILENEFLNRGFDIFFAEGVDDGMHIALEEKPNMIISDFEHIGNEEAGLELLRSMKHVYPRVKFFILLRAVDEEKRLKFLTAGADGVFDKADPQTVCKMLKKT